jgi:hypothetical protein
VAESGRRGDRSQKTQRAHTVRELHSEELGYMRELRALLEPEGQQ